MMDLTDVKEKTLLRDHKNLVYFQKDIRLYCTTVYCQKLKQWPSTDFLDKTECFGKFYLVP